MVWDMYDIYCVLGDINDKILLITMFTYPSTYKSKEYSYDLENINTSLILSEKILKYLTLSRNRMMQE
jgi:hypothetical protein